MKFTLKDTGVDILKSLAYIIDIEEKSKLFHSWRVAIMAKWLSEKQCKGSALPLYIAGLLHDVGTFDLSDYLIHDCDCAADLTAPEILTHPQKGAAIIASLPGFVPIAKLVLNHHEWISGEGYPRGLQGNSISLENQIMRITDKFAFMANGSIQFKDIEEAIKDRLDREFSRELYECLMEELQINNRWESILDDGLLADLNNKIFSGFDIEHDNKVITNRSLLHFFGRILDAKHSYTEGHSQRVAYFSVLIGLAMDLSDEDIVKLESAAFLHDIGKVGIPKKILDKTGPLTDEEFEIIKKHATLSYDIVKGISPFKKLSDIVGSDQEHWDGSGYPYGLKTSQIPVGARIIFVADAFDAMTSNRSYRKAMPVSAAIEELKKCAGKDFDPDIVTIAAKLFTGLKNSSIISSYD